MRIAILWTEMSGYLNGCLRVLAGSPDVSLFLASMDNKKINPFDKDMFSWLSDTYSYADLPNADVLLARLQEFQPDAILVSSWHIPAYRKILRQYRGRAVRVLCSDNQWEGTFKQWLGVLSARWYLHPLYDYAFLSGERQAVFAKKLGFAAGHIWRGLYCCDHPRFESAYRNRMEAVHTKKAFIFVGRLVPERKTPKLGAWFRWLFPERAKGGIGTLVEGYSLYRKMSADPWPLIVCGTGPEEQRLRGIDGIVLKGFVQPGDLPAEFEEAGCFVLPSSFEPWGVVIHEATAAGLGVICTDVCGASVHLVQDFYNGYIIPRKDPRALAKAMARFSALPDADIREFSENSHTLSLQYTPQRWASSLLGRLGEATGKK